MKCFYIFLSVLYTCLSCNASNSNPKPHLKPGDVTITNLGTDYLLLSNGNLGLKIPKASTYHSYAREKTLAPIQSIVYKDGTFSNPSSKVYMTSIRGSADPLSMSVKTLLQSANECIIQVHYTFNKPAFNEYGFGKYSGGDAGPGYYTATISLKKGTKSALIEIESDYDQYFLLPFNNGLKLDKARWRGWESTSAADGYGPDGKAVSGNARGTFDAQVDIKNYNKRLFPYLSLWAPSGAEVNTGRYWQLFNQEAPVSANLLGVFHGRPSRLLGAGSIGVRLITGSYNNLPPQPYLEIMIQRRGDDNSWAAKKRFQFGLFVSTKEDLPAVTAYQPIGIEQNYVAGLGSRIDAYAEKDARVHPSFTTASIYLPENTIQNLITKVKTDNAFYQKLIQIDPNFQPIADVWRNSAQATQVIEEIIKYGEDLKDNFKNRNGYRDNESQYWSGVIRFNQYTTKVMCLLADKTLVIPPDKKLALMKVVRMIARIVWDRDFVPFFDEAGISYGTANMPVQYSNSGLRFYALLFSNDPEFAGRAKAVLSDTRNDIEKAIKEGGETIGTPHYTQPTIEPILYTMLQLKQAGVGDLFTEKKSKLLRFIDFYKSLLTPPSVRFSGNRKLISIGDGSEESTTTFALLAEGLKHIDLTISKSLYSIFQHGPMRWSQFGSIPLAADLVQAYKPDFTTASSNYSGYLSHFRSGVNTTNETAVWFVNGDTYFDHRHEDRGQTIIYALKTPLSLSGSSFYYPYANSAKIKSVVLPLQSFPEWNKANQPIKGLGPVWQTSAQLQFAKLGHTHFAESRQTGAGNTEWRRKVVLIDMDAAKPVIVLLDKINNTEAAIWSMPFMSHGAVVTPAGAITPVNRIWDQNDAPAQLPEATKEQALKGGINQFTFTGQSFPDNRHGTGGINWHVLHIGPGSFTLSQWTNNWQNDTERNEYQQTIGKPYTETQQYLRIKSNSPFFHIVLPFFKGSDPYKNGFTLLSGNKVSIPYSGGTLVLSEKGYLYQEGNKTVLSSFGPDEFSHNNFSIAGGAMEAAIEGGSIKIRIHGANGARTVTLPYSTNFTNLPSEIAVSKSGSSTQISISNNTSNELNLLSNQQGYKEYIINSKN